MTRPLLVFHLLLLLGRVHAQNEIEDLRVETYYISDANDATDEVGGLLSSGSHTYRIFLDLGEGCSLLALYGDTNHVFSISSSAPFFNNLDRGRAFGHLVNNNALDENTVALDSWLSLGAASTQKLGIEKSADPDGSMIGGTNNDGGSAGITGGLLVNTEVAIPLTVQDGLVPLNGAIVPAPGLYQQGDDPTPVLGDSMVRTFFTTDAFILGCATPGVSGPGPGNEVLIAQLTTAGDLHFELNVIVRRADGSTIHFVANDSILLDGEQGYALLTYPPVCGCTNADYLEFDPNAGCDDGSCATAIVFGCLDETACNYDPFANFSVPQLCCFSISDCNGLDPYLVCPEVGVAETDPPGSFHAFPNPTHGELTIQWPGRETATTITLVDAQGRTVLEALVPRLSNANSLDLSKISPGYYFLQIDRNGQRDVLPVVRD